jgi:predicted XRE-type DNA-binding protein
LSDAASPLRNFAEAVYVLHVFEKRTRRTAKADINLAKQRFRALIDQRRRGRDECPMRQRRGPGSRGNVFRDLGFSAAEAEHLRIRSELMAKLQAVIAARELKQAEAAEVLGVTQPRVSDLMRGESICSTRRLSSRCWRSWASEVVLESRRRRAGVA